MIVQPLDLDGKPKGKDFRVIETVSAGADDKVVVIREEGSTRIILNESACTGGYS